MASGHPVQVSRRTKGAAATFSSIRAKLEEMRRALAREIHEYPAPIAACDAQFNHLLEQRTLVLAELARLSETETAAASHKDAAARVAHESHILSGLRPPAV